MVIVSIQICPCCGKPKRPHFDGHRYGLQALKPALEPIVIAQVPYAGRPIDCITETGAGVLNVDGGRIGTDKVKLNNYKPHGAEGVTTYAENSTHAGEEYTSTISQGRWPANFYLDAEAARRLDEQSGTLTSGNLKPYKQNSTEYNVDYAVVGAVRNVERAGDSGGASRFFFRVSEQLDDADPVRYVAKASRRERDAGLEGMPLCEIYPQNNSIERREINAAKGEKARNVHPTVKPLSLTRYLATLLLPPAEFAPRRIFVPFAGVASECIGAMQAGWEDVQGVEITEEYIPIARARVEYWKKRGSQMELHNA